jgi:hypothetical protein
MRGQNCGLISCAADYGNVPKQNFYVSPCLLHYTVRKIFSRILAVGTIIHMTPQSMIYRQKASDLGRQANGATVVKRQFELLLEALRWIHLAENEEILGEEPELIN